MKLLHIPPRVVDVSETTTEFLTKNAIPDLSAEFKQAALAPPQFSLKANMTEVENQGMGETCCSFAVTAALEYIANRLDLSEANLADVGSRTYHGCNAQAGLAIGEAMSVCISQGLVLATDWPYDQSKVCWNPPPNVGGRPHYKFGHVGTIFQRPSVEVFRNMHANMEPQASFRTSSMPGNFVALTKAALVNAQVPVVLDVPVWFNSSHHFDAGWDMGPDIHMPTPAHLAEWLKVCGDMKKNPKDPPGIDGWHAIPVCGYDDTAARFEFKNSWGWWWGNKGYGTIPYDYITQYSRCGMIGSS